MTAAATGPATSLVPGRASGRGRDGLAPVPRAVWAQAAIVVLGASTAMLSSTIATVALPSIAADLHTSPGAVQWVTTGYLLALAAGVPLSGWAARRVGPTRLWLASLVLFAALSVLAALAPSIQVLLVARVLQGAAGGLLVPAGQTVLSIVAGRGRLGRVTSTVGIAVVVAPTLGTTVGSVVVDALSWRWLFWVTLPLCVVAFAAGARWLPRVQTGAAGRLDWPGLLLVLSGLPLLIQGVSAIGGAGGLGSASADAATACGAALLVAFTAWELRTRAPLMRLRLLRNGVFASAAAVMVVGGAISFGAQVVLPLYFLQARSESLLVAGLLLGPQVLGTALGFPLAGRLTDRHGGGALLVAGGVVTALATVPLALVGVRTGYTWLAVVLLVRGFGVALATIPAMTAGLAAVTRDQLPDAAPLLNLLQRTGASVGTAVVAVLYSSHLGGSLGGAPDAGLAAQAFRWASWWLVGGACLLTLPAWLLARAERRARTSPAPSSPLARAA